MCLTHGTTYRLSRPSCICVGAEDWTLVLVLHIKNFIVLKSLLQPLKRCFAIEGGCIWPLFLNSLSSLHLGTLKSGLCTRALLLLFTLMCVYLWYRRDASMEVKGQLCRASLLFYFYLGSGINQAIRPVRQVPLLAEPSCRWFVSFVSFCFVLFLDVVVLHEI